MTIEEIRRPLDDMAVVSALADVCAVAAQHSEKADRAAEFPTEALAEMRRTRLLGLLVPVEFGGAGGGLSDMVDATLALGRIDMSTAMIFAMHCQQVAAVVKFGRAELRADLLPAIARGEVYLASVTTEPGKGGHLLTSQSPVHRTDGMLSIDRIAPIVTGGCEADGFLITALAPEATTPSLVDLFYASRQQLDVEVTGDWAPLGMRATHSIPMRLTGAVPESQVIGEHGGFRRIATTLFGPMAHLGWAAAWLGTAAGALSRVVHHLRGSSGQRQADPTSELLLTRLASIRGRIDVVHAVLRHTLAMVSTAEDLSVPAIQLMLNTLKVRAADECFAAVDELVELVGLRYGYLPDPAMYLERCFRDLRSASLNYANDRLRLANGSLTLLDSGVGLA